VGKKKREITISDFAKIEVQDYVPKVDLKYAYLNPTESTAIKQKPKARKYSTNRYDLK